MFSNHSEGFAEVCAATRRLKGVAVRTPLINNTDLDALTQGKILLKLENLQRTGSFKFRGAFNCISTLQALSTPGGVVAYSTGNHGAAVARAGRIAGLPVALVLPKDAPQAKVEAARSDGAEVVFYDPQTEDREAIAHEVATRRHATLVPPGDDIKVVAGQGTAALEIIEDAQDHPIEYLVVPCGGGGLAAGSTLALQARSPKTKLVIVEPEGFDSMGRSLASARRVGNRENARTICDALRAPLPAELAFKILAASSVRAVTVSDEEVRRAIHWVFNHLKVVLEPAGATPLAALLAKKVDIAGARVALILSGGNVGAEQFSRLIEYSEAK